MSQELLAGIITGLISGIFGLLLGRYGFMRNVTALVDSKVQQMNTESQIALTREQTDLQTVQSLNTNLSSLIELLSKQMLQQAQSTIQQAQLEADKITANNNLASAMRDATEEMRSNQRATGTNLETVLTAYGRSVERVESGFRAISDEFFFANAAFTRITTQMGLDMNDVRSMVDNIRSDVLAQRDLTARGQENLDEIVNIFVDVRNAIMRRLGFSEESLIRAPDDYKPIRMPPDLLLKQSEIIPRKFPDVEADLPPSSDVKPVNTENTKIDTAAETAKEQPNETKS